MYTDEKTHDWKIIVCDEKGTVESEYVIDHRQKKGGTQVFLVATKDAGPEGTTQCIAFCSSGFLTHALKVNAAKSDLIRRAIYSVSNGSGLFGYLKSSSGSFLLGLYTMLGINFFMDGLRINNIVLAIIGAMIAGICFCAHQFLPLQKPSKEIEDKGD